MSAFEEYEVERVIGKRIRGDKVEYRIKWVGYPSTHNSWIKLQNMDCAELIEIFENSKAKIIGVSRVIGNGGIQYAIEWDGSICPPKNVSSAEAKAKFPSLVYEYLISILRFQMPNNRVTFADDIDQIVEADDIEGPPERLLACSDVTGEVLFYCEWANDRKKFVAANIEDADFMRMAAEYLENHLE